MIEETALSFAAYQNTWFDEAHAKVYMDQLRASHNAKLAKKQAEFEKWQSKQALEQLQ